MYAENLENEVTMQIGLTYNDMGTSLFKKGRFQESLTILNESLNFMPTNSGIHLNRGDTYRELKRFNLALSDYHYALDLGGDQSLIHARLSLTHYALGAQCFNQQDYEGANIEFSRAIDFYSNNPEYYVNRARACMQTGSIDMAFADLKKTLDLDPSHEVASAMLQNFNQNSKLAFTGRKFVKIN